MIATFMIEWLKIDGLYKIPKGMHVGIGLHTIFHYMGTVRHHRWLYVSPDGQISWFWLRRSGPAGGIIGDMSEIHLVKPKGLALNRQVRFDCGSRTVELYAPRVEADRLVAFLDRP